MAEATISAKDVKELRDRTGAGMMDCKAALTEAGGDVDKAVEILRVKGQAQAAKRGERAASEGLVTSYVHATGKIGVLVEVNSETDFVARTGPFEEFGRDVALHIAAAAPRYVSEDEVPQEDRDAEMRILQEQAAQQAVEVQAAGPDPASTPETPVADVVTPEESVPAATTPTPDTPQEQPAS